MTQLHMFIDDGTLLVTTVTLKRCTVFRDPVQAREAIECLYRVQQLHPFFLYAFVIMPDHCHFLLRVLPPETVSRIMCSYKSGLTFDTGLKKVWQRRFHIRPIENAVAAKEYIHQNPVRRGLVEIAADYPWSSASGRWDVSPLEEWHVS